MTTTIYFLRHGEVNNPKKILYGRISGFGLSEKGREDVKKISYFFKTKKIKYIFSSPMLRCRQTAAIIGNMINVKPKVSSLLNEVKTFCQGISIDKYRHEIQEKLYNKEFIELGQESREEVFTRMEKLLQMIINKYRNSCILAVSHGDPIMILRAIHEKKKFTFEYKRKNYLRTASYLTLKEDDNKIKFI